MDINFYDKLLLLAQKHLEATSLCECCQNIPPVRIPEFSDYLAVCENCYHELESELNDTLPIEANPLLCYKCGYPMLETHIVSYPPLCTICLWGSH